MEIVDYIGSDGFTHHIINNAMGIPFILWILLICACVSFVHLVLKKIIG